MSVLSHRFVRARTIDLWNRGSHGAQIRRDLPAVVNDVEQEPPGVLVADFVHDGLPAKHEGNGLFPPCVLDRPEWLWQTLAMPIVGREDFLHGRRRRTLFPFELALFEAVDEDHFLADDQPGDFPRSARLRIGAVRGV